MHVVVLAFFARTQSTVYTLYTKFLQVCLLGVVMHRHSMLLVAMSLVAKLPNSFLVLRKLFLGCAGA